MDHLKYIRDSCTHFQLHKQPIKLFLNTTKCASCAYWILSRVHKIYARQQLASSTGNCKGQKIGPLWCGPTRSFIYGAQNNPADDVILKHFTPEATVNATQSNNGEKILLWHERKQSRNCVLRKQPDLKSMKTSPKLCQGRYSGVFIDISRQVHAQYAYLCGFGQYHLVDQIMIML